MMPACLPVLTGLIQASIVIEITEGLLIETQNSVTNQLLHFRNADIHIQLALDDLGTDYSSLAYLNKFN